MLPNRALVALRISSSRKCLRSIHSTANQRAEEAAAAPKKLPGRKERAARISNEVSKLQQQHQGPPAPAQHGQALAPSAGVKDPPSPPASKPGSDLLSTSASGGRSVAVRKRKPTVLPKAAGRAYIPVGFDKKELLRSGEGSATIAGGNFPGVVEDRVRVVLSPGRRVGVEGSSRGQMLQKASQGQVMRVRRGVDDASLRGRLLREETRKVLVGKLVQGRFDGKGLLNGEREGEKALPMDEIERRLLMNGTYLAKDARKLVEKVQGFLTKEQWKKVQLAGVK